MSRAVLFFGASNTRGYGVDPAERFAAILEYELGATLDGAWQFVVSTSPHGFVEFREKLEAAITRTQPAVLVIQCPTNPLSFAINFPRWVNVLRSVQRRHLAWRRERAVAAEINQDPHSIRTRRDALRDGRYVNSVYRFRLTRWSALRRLRTYAGRRYGVLETTTLNEYLQGMISLSATARAHFRGPIIFIGLLPLSEDGFPGYSARADDWNRGLATHLPDAAQHVSFVDVLRPLSQISIARLLLNDETHLTAEGHRRLAELLVPELRAAMKAGSANTR